MTASAHRPGSHSSGYGETRVDLLHATQAYLTFQSRRVAADPAMVHAWEQFFRTYDDIIRRFARSLNVPDGDLEDCVQEVWAAVVGQLRDFRHDPDRSRFRSWLYRLVRNKAIDVFRRRTRHPATCLDSLGESDREPSTGPGVDPVIALQRRWNREVVQAVLRAMRRAVPYRSFRVLYMRRIEEQSVEEVAVALGLTPKQVRDREHRMRRKFGVLIELYTGRDLRSHENGNRGSSRNSARHPAGCCESSDAAAQQRVPTACVTKEVRGGCGYR